MIKKQQTISLDPTAHYDGVLCFMDFYKLRGKTPNLIFLKEILQYFTNIPYENLSKIIKLSKAWDSENKIRLPEEVIEDHISQKLGGTCFSLTFFLQAILSQNGFFSYPVMADMHAGKNIHCFLIVVLNDFKYLVDPGYLLNKPLKINPEKHKIMQNDFIYVELRFDPNTRYFNFFTFNKNKIKWRYRFQDRPVSSEEFLQHWLASFRWNSMHRIYLTKIINNGHVFVRNNFMRKTTFNGKQNFNIKNNFHRAIYDVFGIDRELTEQARTTLQMNLKKERALGFWMPITDTTG